MSDKPARPVLGRPRKAEAAGETDRTRPRKPSGRALRGVASEPLRAAIRDRQSASSSRAEDGDARSPLGRCLPSSEPKEGVRISKLLAERGLCSRREADDYIRQGWVRVDGEVVRELGQRADPSCHLELAPEAGRRQAARVTILLNKPVGFVSGQPEDDYLPAVSLVQPENRYDGCRGGRFQGAHLKGLAPAGRLDIDSIGLLVLTQDGRIARQLVGENSSVDKEYLVRVRGNLIENGLALLNHGLSLDDRALRPAEVSWQNEDQLRFVLNEGRKRQIRRMCELVGLEVVGLKRVRIGRVCLGDLPQGQWRYLGPDESF